MKRQYQFKRFVFILLIINSFYLHSKGQQLIFKNFRHLADNTTARINREKDINGQNCAVLIIKHNIENFIIEAGIGYEALEEKIGETLVWLSPDEYRIIIRKEGYIPFAFDLKDKLMQLETYELVISDEFGTIFVNAPSAQIWLDNKLLANDHFTFTLKEGKYIIKVTRENYYEEEKFVVLNAGNSVRLDFKLRPIIEEKIQLNDTSEFGTIKVNAPNAQIWLDNELIAKDNYAFKLKPDKYALKATREKYYQEEKFVVLNAGDNLEYNFELKPKIEEDEYLNTKSNYALISVGHGISYGSSWGARLGFVSGSKVRMGINGSIGIFKEHVQYAVGLRCHVYKQWNLALQYGTNGYIYNENDGEFMYLQNGVSFLLGYDWFFSEYVGIAWGIGGFYDTNFNNELVFVSEAGVIFRF